MDNRLTTPTIALRVALGLMATLALHLLPF